MTYGSYAARHDDYLYRYYSQYGNPTRTYTGTSTSTTSAATNGTYASGIQDSGFVANTCTDGNDDGKIGFFSAAGNAIEGVAKGAVNGLTGMLGFGKDENGKTTWNPLKTLGTVALGAVCVLCPAVGAVACAVGAVAGGVQVYKGAKAAANATTDAEAKAAWENMGEGASTVVGCIAGATASVGAMKGASTAAKLSSLDDVGKFLGNTDDIAAALGNSDDMIKALNAHGINNTDEVMKALDGVDDINDALKAIGQTGKTSALGTVDDSLTGVEKLTQTAKAFGKDAISSSTNNAGKVWTKATKAYKVGKEVVEYKNAQRKYDKIDLNGALTDDEMRIIKEFEVRDTMVSDDAAEVLTKLDDIDQAKLNYQTAKQNYADTKKALNKATREAKKGGYKGNYTKAEQMAFDDATQTLNLAKEQTPFGKLTTSAKNTNLGQVLSELKTDKNAFKTITSNMNKETLTKIGNALSADGQAIWQFITVNGGSYEQAVNEFGYSKVIEVLQVLFAYGQLEQSV